ncbi:MAG TPA: hypothetical protein VFN20_08250 [Candidatus Acidoferrum sp.]|nr:hypothetical protein [Candidatus Acidoferrum sp.]
MNTTGTSTCRCGSQMKKPYRSRVLRELRTDPPQFRRKRRQSANTPDPTHCSASAGFGFSWQIVKINDETIQDHSGADPDVKTRALFIPGRKTGIVVFASGPDVDNQIIQKIASVLYPNPTYQNTLR